MKSIWPMISKHTELLQENTLNMSPSKTHKSQGSILHSKQETHLI
jgi:hypothetical protein